MASVRKTPRFVRAADGAFDLGLRYNTVNGARHEVKRPQKLVNADMTIIPLSDQARHCSLNWLRHESTPAAVTMFSNRECHQLRAKHICELTEPRDKYRSPVCTSQEYGWKPVELQAPQFARPKCKETHIAEQQILGARNIEPVSTCSKVHF